MQLNILNLLQQLLLPLALGVVVVAGLLVLLAARRPGQRRDAAANPPQRADRADTADRAARSAAPSRPAQARQVAPDGATQADPLPHPPQTAPASAAAVGKAALAPAPAAAALPPAPAVPAAAAPRPRRADLLLVDDSAVVRAKLRRLFEPAGYSLALAPDGEAARTLLGQGRYGLLLTDLEMPRLDGVGLIRAVQADPGCAGMPILAITGHDDLQSQLNQLQAVAGIYRKPWVDDDLLHQVRALVAPTLLPAETEPA